MSGTALAIGPDREWSGRVDEGSFDLAALLGSGGDGRLALDPGTRLNRYGCSVMPRPSAASFSSSTASSISPRAFGRAGVALASWKKAASSRDPWVALDRKVDELRDEMSGLLGLAGTGVDIVFSPSGTDSQLHALALVRAWLGTPLVTIVVAADETGSGTAFTASGRHFGDRAAHGPAVCQGSLLDGMSGIAEAIRIPCSGPDGARSLAAIDDAVIAAVAEADRAGRKILVQAMNASKLGRRCPSDDCLDLIRRRWSGSARIVVDACQMRLSRTRLRHHLDRGDMVLVTGSKFFTGPAFSGALLVPPRARTSPAGDLALPPGLSPYGSRQDWPSRYATIRAALPARLVLGPWLRWEAALAEMSAYFAVPLRFRRHALRSFARAAAERLSGSASCRFIPAPEGAGREDDDEFSTPTIFPFLVRSGAAWATPEHTAALHRAMNRDMAQALPPGATPAEHDLASRVCPIGQPVPMTTLHGSTAALRVSADARFVTDCWSPDPARCRRRLADHLDHLGRAFDKLDLLERTCDP